MSRVVLVSITLAGALLTACASAPARPTPEYVRAQTLIEQAERNGAQRFAAADLDRARDKLRQSDAARNADKEMMADRFATEAAVDAELALARSSTAQAEKSAAEVRASVETLRAESERGELRP
jgi:hypothetical protein